jgi:hypothetical protein
VLSVIAKLLRLASSVICLIVIASFIVFAANQTKSASNGQQEVINGTGNPQSGASTSAPQAKHPHARKNAFHKALDEASDELTSPFSGIFSGSHSEWGTRGGELVLALLLYGFGLGYLARMLRVRA